MEFALLIPVLVLSLAFAASVLIYSVEKVAGRRISLFRRTTHPESPTRSAHRPSSTGEVSFALYTLAIAVGLQIWSFFVPCLGPPGILKNTYSRKLRNFVANIKGLPNRNLDVLC